MKYIICDLDGTLSLTGHRQHFLDQSPPDWDGFYAASVDDEPNEPVILLMKAISEYFIGEAAIVILSGRSDTVYNETVSWLSQHEVAYDLIKMRKAGDFTPDNELKQRWLEEFGAENVLFCIDDRQKVVDMWRSEGLPCFQVAPGNF